MTSCLFSLICPRLSKTAVISLRSPLFSSANLKISMLSISSSKNSCLDRIKIPFFFLFSNIIIFFLASFTLFSSTSTPSSSLSNSKYKVCIFFLSSSAKFLEKVILKLFIFFLPISHQSSREYFNFSDCHPFQKCSISLM